MSIRTIENLNDYMLLHGHQRLGDFELNDEFIKFIKEVNDLEVPYLNGANFKYITKIKMKKNAKEFLERFYKTHKVGFLPDIKLMSLNDIEVHSIDEVVALYNDSIKYISPYRLPLSYDLENVNGGTLVTQSLIIENKEFNNELLSRINMSFTRIRLPKTVTDIATASYIHELTHSQIESTKGLINDYYNAEVLSVFTELFYAYKTNTTLFYFALLNRLNGILMYFHSIYTFNQTNDRSGILEDSEYSDFDYHSDIKYITSILKAINLLSLYTRDMRLAAIITNEINNVFNGYSSIEDLLDSLEVNNETSMNIDNIKRLIKD